LGIAERSPTHGSSLYGAAFHTGEGIWARSEAQSTGRFGSVTTTSSTEAARLGSGTQGNADTQTEIPFSIEQRGCRELNGARTDACQEEATGFLDCFRSMPIAPSTHSPELCGIFDRLCEPAGNPTKPVTADDIVRTRRNIRELTKVGEREIHEAVLSCTRARRQFLNSLPITKPSCH
jgi:hypothetical protein